MVGRQKSTEILTTLAEKELHSHYFAIGQLKVRTKVTGYIKKHELTGQVLGGDNLSLPEKYWKPWACGFTVTGVSGQG